jgi:uncharacterized protein involved in oxidation of intracellular sulfur
MSILFLLNEAPYGSEKAYNALRLALQIKKDSPDTTVRIFLMADAVFCALPSQHTPDGYYNVERFIKGVVGRGCEVKLCGSCMDARGMVDSRLVEGAKRSNLAELSAWVLDSEKCMVF